MQPSEEKSEFISKQNARTYTANLAGYTSSK